MRWFILLIFVSIAGIFIYQQVKDRVNHDLAQPIVYPSETPEPTSGHVNAHTSTTTALFVPYWTVSQRMPAIDGFDEYVYFGVTPTMQGISPTDSMLGSIQHFMDNAPSDKQKLLTVSMTNSQTNFIVLKQADSQKKIIADAISLAQKEKFAGIVLDLEVSGIPFPSLEQQITTFVQSF